MVDPARIIEELNRAEVDYVVIGGVAATLHGCPEQTYDLDIFYADTAGNRGRLLEGLKAIKAEWERPLDDSVLQRQTVFALNTKYGDLDIFSSVLGLNGYDEAKANSQTVEYWGMSVRVLDLPLLILAKEVAADPNPRKQAALAFLKELEKRRG